MESAAPFQLLGLELELDLLEQKGADPGPHDLGEAPLPLQKQVVIAKGR